MNEPIDVSEDEIASAAEKARFVNYVDLPLIHVDEAVKLVRATINIINRKRMGDPVGTIRKPSPTSGIGVRVHATHPKDWRIIHTNGETRWEAFDYVADWPVIYSPEA